MKSSFAQFSVVALTAVALTGCTTTSTSSHASSPASASANANASTSTTPSTSSTSSSSTSATPSTSAAAGGAAPSPSGSTTWVGDPTAHEWTPADKVHPASLTDATPLDDKTCSDSKKLYTAAGFLFMCDPPKYLPVTRCTDDDAEAKKQAGKGAVKTTQSREPHHPVTYSKLPDDKVRYEAWFIFAGQTHRAGIGIYVYPKGEKPQAGKAVPATIYKSPTTDPTGDSIAGTGLCYAS